MSQVAMPLGRRMIKKEFGISVDIEDMTDTLELRLDLLARRDVYRASLSLYMHFLEQRSNSWSLRAGENVIYDNLPQLDPEKKRVRFTLPSSFNDRVLEVRRKRGQSFSQFLTRSVVLTDKVLREKEKGMPLTYEREGQSIEVIYIL